MPNTTARPPRGVSRPRRSKAMNLVKERTAWIAQMRYRALAWVLAIILATVATITFAGAPWAPIVGVAVAAALVSFSKLTTRLLQPVCLNCGKDLSREPIGAHGIACPDCGAVQTPNLIDIAKMDSDDRGRA